MWGVLNVTPDSFSDGGLHFELDAALEHARAMLRAGADVIDVGGASSRPRGALYGAGAADVSAAEELRRVVPVVRALVEQLGACVSVDTVRAEVARQSVAAGARILNDVSCAAHADLLEVAGCSDVELVLMHNRGDGAVAAPHTDYVDVAGEVAAELQAAVERALALGVPRERIWVDPGLGFAKTAAQSLQLLGRLQALHALGLPLLVGPSRKGFIGEAAPRADGSLPGPAERVGGTAAAVTVAVLGGAGAVRVHDVALMRQAVLVAQAIDAEGRERRSGAAA